ncbi:hypothetical protein FPHYL_9100 [Fusarium phyllophilum]|uniref:Uncharacterized protein n=1 Tax=Fusarium phyllophilum TaxID=47803 RepID=A0A8H5JA84_9HYPO|nr:hypothetical protein FPHYL_9100 [Fusarium phyllophilum]
MRERFNTTINTVKHSSSIPQSRRYTRAKTTRPVQAAAQTTLHDIITLHTLHDLEPSSRLYESSNIVTMAPILQTIAIMARDVADNDNVLRDKALGPSATIRLVAAITTSGWITFGLIIGLVLNTRGKASSFVPEWYLDSNGSIWAKLAVAAWWVSIILFWPVICVVYVILAAGRGIRNLFLNCGVKRKQETEREASEVTLV